MKSPFLKHLADLLIVDKETDYIDIYNLQLIKNWPLFTVAYYDSETNEDVESKLVVDISQYKPEDVEPLGLENCEIKELNEEHLILYACGDSQPPQNIKINLLNDELVIDSCVDCPELKEEDYTEEQLEEYEKYINKIQETLENQD